MRVRRHSRDGPVVGQDKEGPDGCFDFVEELGEASGAALADIIGVIGRFVQNCTLSRLRQERGANVA